VRRDLSLSRSPQSSDSLFTPSSLVTINKPNSLSLMLTSSTCSGLSLAVSLVSVHYLLKNWGREPSHLIVTGFTFLLLAFNIAVFGLRIVTVLNSVRATLCPNGNPAFKLAFQPDSFVASENDGHAINYTSAWNVARGVTLTTIPAFLWISDAFLVSPASKPPPFW
jgi:hypothetical protein